jgi:hypothetical protein
MNKSRTHHRLVAETETSSTCSRGHPVDRMGSPLPTGHFRTEIRCLSQAVVAVALQITRFKSGHRYRISKEMPIYSEVVVTQPQAAWAAGMAPGLVSSEESPITKVASTDNLFLGPQSPESEAQEQRQAIAAQALEGPTTRVAPLVRVSSPSSRTIR